MRRWILILLGVATASGCPGASGIIPGDDDDDNSQLCVDAPGDVSTSRARSRQCGVGAEAAFLLRSSPYSQIRVEVDATSDVTPRQDALDHLVAVIEDVTDKPGGVTLVVSDTDLSPPGEPLSVAAAQAMEDGARNEFPLGSVGTLYFLYTSGNYDQDTDQFKVLGFAHRATSLVIFQETIDGISGGIGQPSSENVEATVLAHELGHVLGLVNIGTPMVDPHEDAGHPAHDENEDCLMYFANNSSDLVANLLAGGVVPDLDAECRNDLAAVRSGP